MSRLRPLLLSAAALALLGCPQNPAGSASSASAASSAGASSGSTSGGTSGAGSSGGASSGGASTGGPAGSTAASSSGSGTTSGGSTGGIAASSGSSSGTTGTRAFTWSNMALPSGVEGLYSVQGRSATDVYASGDIGKIIHWDGAAWSVYWESGSNDEIRSVALTASGQLYAVGSQVYGCLANCGDSNNMATLSVSGTGCYPSAACSSGNDVYVVGIDSNNLGCLLKADGVGGWSHTSLPLYFPNGCWVDPASSTVYIGAHGGIVSYTAQFGAGEEDINWPSGTSSTDKLYVDFKAVWGEGAHAFAVGGNRRVFSKGASGWDLVLNVSAIDPNTEDSSFDALAGAGGEAFAFGDDLGSHQAAHWDGVSWGYLPGDLRSGAFLSGAWAASPDDYFVVGTASVGQGLILRGHR